MKAGKSKLDVGQRVTITGFKGDDAIYNGLTATVTHPFAFGCTDNGWVGLYMECETVYGYQLNAHETELTPIINERQMDFSKLTDQEVINVLDVACALQNKITGELNQVEIECVGDILSGIIDRTNELYAECGKRNINLNN